MWKRYKEALKRVYKYGSSWVLAEEDTLERMNTKKGIDIHGFFALKDLAHFFCLCSRTGFP